MLAQLHLCCTGDAKAVAEWYGKLGYTMPYGINAADFILDLASGVVTTNKLDGEESRVHCIACAERYLAAHPLGYLQGSEISETQLGSDLWFSAQVGLLPPMLSTMAVTACCAHEQLVCLKSCITLA